MPCDAPGERDVASSRRCGEQAGVDAVLEERAELACRYPQRLDGGEPLTYSGMRFFSRRVSLASLSQMRAQVALNDAIGGIEVDIVEPAGSRGQGVEDALLDRAATLRLRVGNVVEHHH